MNEISFQEFTLRLLLAVAFGGAVGLEREKHGRAAGFRTNILVCMGAALVMMCSQQIFSLFKDLPGLESVARVDPGRIASGIIMGIGFLGAGAIVRQENLTRGLTTAACLWLVTAVGIALGLGEYFWASATTVIALLVLLPLKRVERLLEVDRYGALEVVGDSRTVSHESVGKVLSELSIQIQTYSVKHNKPRNEKTFVFNVKFTGQAEAEKVADAVAGLQGVTSVEWR